MGRRLRFGKMLVRSFWFLIIQKQKIFGGNFEWESGQGGNSFRISG